MHEQAIKIALRMLEQGIDRDRARGHSAKLKPIWQRITTTNTGPQPIPWAFDINNYLYAWSILPDLNIASR